MPSGFSFGVPKRIRELNFPKWEGWARLYDENLATPAQSEMRLCVLVDRAMVLELRVLRLTFACTGSEPEYACSAIAYLNVECSLLASIS
jgi:hypothetical protein